MIKNSELISSGCVCEVYLSFDKDTGLKKIIKVYPEKNREFYETEKMVLLKYKTINFPALIDSYINDEGCIIETEYIDGKTLYNYIIENGRMKRKQAAGVMMKLTEALYKFYRISEERFIIGDLSANNIILRKDGEISIIDLNSVSERKHELKGTTIAYFDRGMLKKPDSNINCDIYSLGILYLFMLTGDTGHEGIAAVDARDAGIIRSCVIKKDIEDLEELKRLFDQKEGEKKIRSFFKRNIAVVGCTEFALELAYTIYNSGFCVSLTGDGIHSGSSGFFIKNCGDFELDRSGNEDVMISLYEDLNEAGMNNPHRIFIAIPANTYSIEEILDKDIKDKSEVSFVFFKYDKKYMLSKEYIKRLLPNQSIFFIGNTKKRIMSYETGYVKYIRDIKASKEYKVIIKSITGV